MSLKINLLVIGTQKSGTTSLHNYLHQLKEVHMSQPIKEPGFFLPFDVIQKYYANKSIQLKDPFHLLNKYMLKGYQGEKIIGESSTFYSNDEFNHQGLPQKIYDYNSNMKLIYLLRNPIDRIISHFQHELQQRNISQDINKFISNRIDVLGITDYKKQLKPYLPLFTKKRICVLLFENMISSNWNNKYLLDFLEIHPINKVALDHYNVSQNPSIKEALIRAINKNNKQQIAALKQEQMDYFTEAFNLDFSSWLRA